MNSITINVGEELFRFTSIRDWVVHARDRFKRAGVKGDEVICIDARGYVLTDGKGFIAAQQRDTYPVRVFRAEVDRP
jgi:hypothetical protein